MKFFIILPKTEITPEQYQKLEQLKQITKEIIPSISTKVIKDDQFKKLIDKTDSQNEHKKTYYNKHKDKIREQAKQYYKNNRERLLKAQKERNLKKKQLKKELKVMNLIKDIGSQN